METNSQVAEINSQAVITNNSGVDRLVQQGDLEVSEEGHLAGNQNSNQPTHGLKLQAHHEEIQIEEE